MYILIVLWPLMGAVIAGMFGRYVGEEGAVRVTTMLVGGASIMSIYGLYEVGVCGNEVRLRVCRWVKVGMMEVDWGMMYDSLTVVMLVVVTVISTLVHIYGGEYMRGDPHRQRFMSYLSLFTFFMIILVTGDNYMQMFVGWEGVGLCSYLLINYWYTRIRANKAAIQAMLVNRVGDVGLALGIMTIYGMYKAVDYGTVFSVGPRVMGEGWDMELVGVLLLVGAVGKSAQIGLHTWLPNAMEGPTPVSALIHAATMVTAGVYLIARSSPIMEYAPGALKVVTVMGGMTALMAGTIGMMQNDVKKVVAYSTGSQLGYMIVVCGLSGYEVGIYHVGNHAFFKALLFMCGGAVIHGMGDEQDMRRMGGLVRVMPYTYGMMFIGTMALMGFPYMSGYYSKDLIMEIAYGKATTGESVRWEGVWAYGLGSVAAYVTAYYSIRVLHLTFWVKAGGNKRVMEGAHEGNWGLKGPLLVLGIGSILVGYLWGDMVVGVGTDFWGNAIYVHPENKRIIEAESLPTINRWVPVIGAVGGMVTAWVVYRYNEGGLYRMKVGKWKGLYVFLNKKWLFDKVYREWVSQGLLNQGYKTTYKGIDRGVLEMLGPSGITSELYESAKRISRGEKGHMYNKIMGMMLGIVLLLII
uniref:NADH-ubiquinone oxidoreductase chain 5 n=1 Tax=Labyrinthula sp. TaxID=1678526 RepID=A0A7S6U9R0_9STRA|nr:NADH dehydrogenase subunit 5 [Labyrinthula sp.]